MTHWWAEKGIFNKDPFEKFKIRLHTQKPNKYQSRIKTFGYDLVLQKSVFQSIKYLTAHQFHWEFSMRKVDQHVEKWIKACLHHCKKLKFGGEMAAKISGNRYCSLHVPPSVDMNSYQKHVELMIHRSWSLAYYLGRTVIKESRNK